MREVIEKSLILIKEQTGVDLILCPYFTGVKYLNGKPYFNIVLKDKICESLEYDELKRWSDKYNIINIENNGLKRLAIFI